VNFQGYKPCTNLKHLILQVMNSNEQNSFTNNCEARCVGSWDSE
jgi:hypothetical protein